MFEFVSWSFVWRLFIQEDLGVILTHFCKQKILKNFHFSMRVNQKIGRVKKGRGFEIQN